MYIKCTLTRQMLPFLPSDASLGLTLGLKQQKMPICLLFTIYDIIANFVYSITSTEGKVRQTLQRKDIASESPSLLLLLQFDPELRTRSLFSRPSLRSLPLLLVLFALRRNDDGHERTWPGPMLVVGIIVEWIRRLPLWKDIGLRIRVEWPKLHRNRNRTLSPIRRGVCSRRPPWTRRLGGQRGRGNVREVRPCPGPGG